MKKISVLFFACTALIAGAQNKIDFAGRLAIENVRALQSGNELIAPMATGVSEKQTYNVIVEFADSDIDFGDVAVDEISRIGNMAIVTATALQLEQLAALPQVKSVTMGIEKQASMYVARPACKVDAVQQGTDGLGSKYTGKGVVTGLYDVGLDINHINFLDADGEPRTKAAWSFTSNGRVSSYTTPTQIKNFTTEDDTQTHGTHVLGIMAGSYNGPATYAVNENNKAVLIKQDEAGSAVPFYGVATEADIAVACGSLADGNILAGVQKVVDYAKEKGQPCVVNLSIGSNIGPHDGTDATCKYLAELGNDAIICIAAGNEGEENISISVSGKTVKTFVVPTSNSSGMVQFWASDDRPFTIRFIGYDRSKSKEVFSYTLDENLEGKSVSQGAMQGFRDAFVGSVALSSNIATYNNRYNVSANVNVTGTSSSVSAAFVIEPLDGQTVDGFANAMEFSSQSVAGFTNGNAKNSISNMACGENVVVVGSFTTAPQWAALLSNGEKASINRYDPKPSVGAISAFSSYGTTFGGKQLPDLCAPGEGIISSFSQYYVNRNASVLTGWLTGEYAAPKGAFSRNSPWGLMQGTSMACPFVAGVVASWLQADPTLTVADVQSIIKKTCVTDILTASARARFGAGKLDALAGIKEVISQSGINEIAAAGNGAIVTSDDGRNFEIYVPGASRVAVRLFALSGLCAANVTSDGETVALNAENVTPGIYVMKIDSGKDSETRKIVIK